MVAKHLLFGFIYLKCCIHAPSRRPWCSGRWSDHMCQMSEELVRPMFWKQMPFNPSCLNEARLKWKSGSASHLCASCCSKMWLHQRTREMAFQKFQLWMLVWSDFSLSTTEHPWKSLSSAFGLILSLFSHHFLLPSWQKWVPLRWERSSGSGTLIGDASRDNSKPESQRGCVRPDPANYKHRVIKTKA